MDILFTTQDGKKSPFFFPMQGDIYLGSRLGNNLSFLTQFGLQRAAIPPCARSSAWSTASPYNAT